jgi:hypothetical protein
MSMSEEQETNPSPTAGAKPDGGGRRRHRGRRGGRGRSRSLQPKPAAVVEGARQPESAPLIERVAALTERVAVKDAPPGSAIRQAVNEVMQIVESLKRVVDQMEEVLELVELADRQKLGDEQEIESLRRALRQLQRPRSGRPSDETSHSL